MKKIAVFLTISLLTHSLHAIIDLKDIKDISYVGVAVAAGALGATIAGFYLHPAAAERARIEAKQENKRFQEQKDRESRQKAEIEERDRRNAHITLHKLLHKYTQEIDALQAQRLSREALKKFVKSNHTSPYSRFKDYCDTLTADTNLAHAISVLVSPDEKKQANLFISQLVELAHTINLELSEDIHAEQEEAKRIKRHEQAEQHRIEREELENKKLKGEVEAQTTVKNIYELVKAIKHDTDLSKQAEKRTDFQLTEITRQLKLAVETIETAIAAGNAQFANRLASLLQKEIGDAKKVVQDVLQNQSAVQQAPPPYNPAAIAAMNVTASEAIDPAPTYK